MRYQITTNKIYNKIHIGKIFLLGLLIFVSSCNKTSHILPGKYSITTEESFSTAISYGRVLKVKNPIEIEDLKNYPKDYKKNIIRTEVKILVKWIELDSLAGRKGVIANIQQTLDFGDYPQIENLLEQIENTDNKFYFAGLGVVMKGLKNEKHNYYQFMYFLNINTNEIYEFDDIH